MSNILRRPLTNSIAWAVYADLPALGAGLLIVLAFRPG